MLPTSVVFRCYRRPPIHFIHHTNDLYARWCWVRNGCVRNGAGCLARNGYVLVVLGAGGFARNGWVVLGAERPENEWEAPLGPVCRGRIVVHYCSDPLSLHFFFRCRHFHFFIKVNTSHLCRMLVSIFWNNIAVFIDIDTLCTVLPGALELALQRPYGTTYTCL